MRTSGVADGAVRHDIMSGANMGEVIRTSVPRLCYFASVPRNILYCLFETSEYQVRKQKKCVNYIRSVLHYTMVSIYSRILNLSSKTCHFTEQQFLAGATFKDKCAGMLFASKFIR